MSVNNPSKLCQPQLPQLYYNSPQTQEVITVNVVENNLTDSDYAVVEKNLYSYNNQSRGCKNRSHQLGLAHDCKSLLRHPLWL